MRQHTRKDFLSLCKLVWVTISALWVMASYSETRFHVYTAGQVGAFRALTHWEAMAGAFEGGLEEAAGFQPYSGEPAGIAETW